MKALFVVVVVTVSCLVIGSCDTPGIRLVEPDVQSDPGSSGVTFVVHLEDSVLAEALGWSAGVPEATVFVQRVGEPFAPESLTTDSSGEVQVSVILPGQVHVAAYRVLDEDETGPTGGVIRAFGDGRTRDISSGKTVPLNLRADSAGSIVISEWYPGHTLHYSHGGYVELYNNSDTIVYLDGMLLGKGWPVVSEIETWPCSESEFWRNDPRGLWSRAMHAFPGSGHDYPVMPGDAVTVALDAVDHSVADAGLPDLSSADFELEGNADSDNPDVPNLPYLGPVSDLAGHGVRVGGSGVLFLSNPVDFESLSRGRTHRSEYVRVPTERLLDVMDMENGANYVHEKMLRPCDVAVPRTLERLKGGYLNSREHLSLAVHRRLVHLAEAERIVLQDVNTSFVDFVIGVRSPGRIEY